MGLAVNSKGNGMSVKLIVCAQGVSFTRRMPLRRSFMHMLDTNHRASGAAQFAQSVTPPVQRHRNKTLLDATLTVI